MKSKIYVVFCFGIPFLVILLSSSDTFSTVYEVFVRNNFLHLQMNINVEIP
ncbi:MAG: hypothetical protein IPM38_16465 [Ignavibacteria bacterium]|nr:hypothetical protein [Ignavibacteria bacterium]